MVAELLKKFKTEHNAVNAKDKVSMNIVSMNQMCEMFSYNFAMFAVGMDSSSSCC